MATKQFLDSHNFGVRDTMMRHKVYEKLMFYALSGQISADTGSNVGLLNNSNQIEMPANSVVHRLDGTTFTKEGTDYVHMPMINRLVQPDIHGNQVLTGRGESPTYMFRKQSFNETNYVVTLKRGVMDGIRTSQWERQIQNAEPLLANLLAERLNANFIAAMYEGNSLNVTEGLNNSPDGIGMPVLWHPNMYWWNNNATIDPVGTEGKNKTSAEVTTASDQANLKTPNLDCLYAISEKLTECNIQKGFMVDGALHWLAVINLKTWHNLIKDTGVKSILLAAQSGQSYKSVFFGKTMYRVGDFVFLIDEIAARSWYKNLAGSPGGEGTFGSYAADSQNNMTLGYHGKPAYATPNTTMTIYGEGSLQWANVIPATLKTEEENFGKQSELAATVVYGIGRVDWVDKSLEGTVFDAGKDDKTVLTANYITNQSSAVILLKP